MAGGAEDAAAGIPARFLPRPLEVACGLVLGVDEDAPHLDGAGRAQGRSVFETSVREALERPPCLVSFSGGRDSSAVLAVAVAVARREGLPEPVPISYRFAGAPDSREDDWQERVARHVGVTDWERLAMTTEIDTVGPVARSVLARHGVVWPFNAHFHVPLLERAASGSLLTGVGGDELLGVPLWSSLRTLLAGRARRRKVRLASVAAALSPLPVRRWALDGRNRQRWPWMRPEAEAEVKRQLVEFRARTPRTWTGAVGWWWRSRYREVLTATVEGLARDAGAQIVQPFLDPRVVAAFTRHFGMAGPIDRSAAMRDLFADVLPDDILDRRSKAHFTDAFISEHSRAFAASWDGNGVDGTLVDPDRLAAEWGAEHPDPRSLSLMQATWLATRASTTR